jgi:hypothetical protein
VARFCRATIKMADRPPLQTTRPDSPMPLRQLSCSSPDGSARATSW